MHTLNLRSFLWFATGVALTVTSLAVFGTWRVDAVVTPAESTFVPVVPCRLLDTRPDFQVGPRKTPIDQTPYAQKVTGTNGECTIPAGATAVAMNVTVVNPNASSYLVAYPSDAATIPKASNLNFVAGQAPTPNKVDVKLSATGTVSFYNNTGTVDVLGDIVGYYQSSTVADLQARLAAAEAKLTAQAASVDSLLTDTNVIPSGKSITGFQSFDGTVAVGTPYTAQVVELQGRLPVPLTSDQINGSATSGFDDADPTCAGTFAAPTAPAGKICIYPDFTSRNRRNVDLGATYGAVPTVLADDNFIVFIAPEAVAVGNPLTLRFSWTYTAP